MRSRFEEDPAFQAIAEDAERARLFKEYCKALKVSGWEGEEVDVHVRPRNGPLVCKTLAFVGFCGFYLRIPGVAHIVRPHPDN